MPDKLKRSGSKESLSSSSSSSSDDEKSTKQPTPAKAKPEPLAPPLETNEEEEKSETTNEDKQNELIKPERPESPTFDAGAFISTTVQSFDRAKMMQLLTFIWAFIDIVMPICTSLFNIGAVYWEQYKLDDVVPLAGGVTMTFLGGHYMTTIAAAEAVYLCGWRRTKTAAQVVYYNLKKAKFEMDREAPRWKKSNLSDQQIYHRKVIILLRCVDPDQLSNLFLGFWTAMLSVMACLRTRLVRVVTLGNAIGGMIHKAIGSHLQALVSKATPPAYQRWTPVLTRYTIKLCCMMVAVWMFRMVCACHSAFRGAQLVKRGLHHLALKKKLMPASVKEGSSAAQMLDYVYLGIGGILAVLGIYWQLTTSFVLPWWLSLILFPFSFVEWLLTKFIVFL